MCECECECVCVCVSVNVSVCVCVSVSVCVMLLSPIDRYTHTYFQVNGKLFALCQLGQEMFQLPFSINECVWHIFQFPWSL